MDINQSFYVLQNQIRQTLTSDQFKLKQILNHIKKLNSKDRSEQLQNLEKKIRTSRNKVSARKATIPKLNIPKSLPIAAKQSEIQAAIENNQVVVITGETGSGKTTQIPKLCLKAGRGVFGKIGCTQPRRIAATSLARQVAKEMNIELGKQVGYKIRFDARCDENTLIQFMTDGILLTEVQSDRNLIQYDTIIIDEAHERTLNIDFLLGYLRKLLIKRKDLKLIITSATIDVDKFAAAFPQFYHIKRDQYFADHINPQKQSDSKAPAPIIEVSGRMYPVEVRYHPIDEKLEEEGNISIINMVQEAVEDILTETSEGDILVFLSGVQEIREAFEQLQFLHAEGFDVLPLFSRLSGGEQNRIFEVGPHRKIILATNIAETSITIPRIRYVIDSGKARISQYNTRSGTQGLPISRISQSSANQRKGRCGRIANGICIRLYTEEDFLSRPEYATPEIQRSDLSDVIMRMLRLNLGDVKQFPFIDPPESAQIKAGYRTLTELGALDDKKRLSVVGKQISKLPVDPRTARMIMQAHYEDSLYAVLIIASVISCQDPREWPENKKPQAMQKHARFNSKTSDLITYLNLWEHYHNTWEELKTQNKMRKFCKANFLSYIRMREWRDIHNQLEDIVTANKWKICKPDQWDNDGIHKSILAGYLTHIAKKKEKKIYTGTKNRELLLFPGSGQYKNRHEWIVAVEIIETSKLYAHSIAKIDPDWLEPLAGSLCKVTWELPRWDEKGQNVVANENVSLFGFKIVDSRKVNYGKIDIEEATSVFIREALVDRKFRSTMPFWKHNLKLIKSIEEKENQTRKRDLLVSEYQLEKFYQSKVHQVSCIQDLQKLIKENGGDKFLFLKESDLLLKKPAEDQGHFPKFMDIISHRCPLVYKFDPNLEDDGVTLKVPESVLNHLRPETFEYLVPGVLDDKILWLIKNLPKTKRKHLLPISDTAQKVWESMTSLRYSSEDTKSKTGIKQDFYRELSETIFSITKIYIEPNEWIITDMPPYLKMNFAVVNSKHKIVKQGRNLTALQGKNGKKEDNWIQLIRPYEQYLITDWDFQNLMEEVVISKTDSVPIWGYRTLEANPDGIKLTLYKSKEQAEKASITAVSELLKIKLAPELAWLYEELGFPEQTIFHFQNLWQNDIALNMHALNAKFGKANNKIYKKFRDQLQCEASEMIINSLLGFSGSMITTQKQFLKKIKTSQSELKGLGKRVINWISETMQMRFEVICQVNQMLSTKATDYWSHLKLECQNLIPQNCLKIIPLEHWQHLPRILKGYLRRIERYQSAPDKVEEKFDEIYDLIDHFEKLHSGHQSNDIKIKYHFQHLKWMIEELKVSVFAQDLKTAFPISRKRIENYISKHF